MILAKSVRSRETIKLSTYEFVVIISTAVSFVLENMKNSA